MAGRPEFIRHYTAIQEPVGEGDLRAQAARFGEALGLTRLGVNLEIISPGCRSSWPHAHSLEEEFVFVLEGEPDVWIDGHLHRLRPGDGVAFPAGTGISHTFINNTNAEIRLLIVGERNPNDRTIYPLDSGPAAAIACVARGAPAPPRSASRDIRSPPLTLSARSASWRAQSAAGVFAAPSGMRFGSRSSMPDTVTARSADAARALLSWPGRTCRPANSPCVEAAVEPTVPRRKGAGLLQRMRKSAGLRA